MRKFLDELGSFGDWQASLDAAFDGDLSVTVLSDEQASKFLHEYYEYLDTPTGGGAYDLVVGEFKAPSWAGNVSNEADLSPDDECEVLLAHHWVERTAPGSPIGNDHFLWLLVKVIP